MSKSTTPASSLSPQIAVTDKNQLSKLQQQFNKKVKQIEKLKQDMAAREESINLAKKRIEKELKPITSKIIEKRVELVKLLDEAYPLTFFRKREKEKLAYLISDIAFDLVDKYGREDMLEIHDKYSDLSFEETIAEEEEDARFIAEQLISDVFGVDIQVDDLDDFDSIQAQLDREMEQREQEKQKRQKNRKTKAQLAKEAKAKAELQNISKASRRVYTELAKLLHPDAEQDPEVRIWKEEAMKRVTQAYHHDDFFELLRLQMEFTQEQSQVLNKLPDEQLKYYIKILSDQIRELQYELDDFRFTPEAQLLHQFGGTPKQMDQKFKYAKEDLNAELQQLTRDLRNLQDPQEIRQLLKELR